MFFVLFFLSLEAMLIGFPAPDSYQMVTDQYSAEDWSMIHQARAVTLSDICYMKFLARGLYSDNMLTTIYL